MQSTSAADIAIGKLARKGYRLEQALQSAGHALMTTSQDSTHASERQRSRCKLMSELCRSRMQRRQHLFVPPTCGCGTASTQLHGTEIQSRSTFEVEIKTEVPLAAMGCSAGDSCLVLVWCEPGQRDSRWAAPYAHEDVRVVIRFCKLFCKRAAV